MDEQGRGRRRGTDKVRGKAAPDGIVPDPPAVLHITPFVWRAGIPIHRIHLSQYIADRFNPGIEGNARFSPIVDAGGAPVPTLYGGSSFDCAAMETVFHDVPFSSGFKSYDKRKLQGHVHSMLMPACDMTLADLRNVPLRKLGVERGRLIDTEKDTYPRTRKWASAIHAQHPDVQGLCWTSPQDDRAIALILFGKLLLPSTLRQEGTSRPLLDDVAAYSELLGLADVIGVSIV